MKCPKCQLRELDVDFCKGYSFDPVKYCNTCGFKWVKWHGEEIKPIGKE